MTKRKSTVKLHPREAIHRKQYPAIHSKAMDWTVAKMVASKELGPKSTNEYIKLVKMIVASAKDPKTRRQLYPVFRIPLARSSVGSSVWRRATNSKFSPLTPWHAALTENCAIRAR